MRGLQNMAGEAVAHHVWMNMGW
ncbi:MAG: hypothetical protein RJB52_895, partial [Pseudomonadota bacterium]